MSYEALTKKLTELTAAASPGPWVATCPANPNMESHGLEATFPEGLGEIAEIFECQDATLAAPAHEYAAAALALVKMMGGYDVNDGHWDLCAHVLYGEHGTCDCGAGALDALQKALGL